MRAGGSLWSCSGSGWAWGWVPVVRQGVVVRDDIELAETLLRAVVEAKGGVRDVFGVDEGVAVEIDGLGGGDQADAWGSVSEGEGRLAGGRRGGEEGWAYATP